MEHIYHILRRVRGSKTVFQCADPTCTWRDNKKFLIGKVFICYRCLKEYIATGKALNLSRPHCEMCTRGAAGKEAQEKEKTTADLLKKLGLAS